MTVRRREALAGLLAVLLLAGTAALLATCPAGDPGDGGGSPLPGASGPETPGSDETSARAPPRPRANVAATTPSAFEPPASPASDPLWTPLARDLPAGVLLVRREGGTPETARYLPSPSGDLVVVMLGVGATGASAPPSIESVEVATGARRRLVAEGFSDARGRWFRAEFAWSSEGRLRYVESRSSSDRELDEQSRWAEIDPWTGTRSGESAWFADPRWFGPRGELVRLRPDVSIADHGTSDRLSGHDRVEIDRVHLGGVAEPTTYIFPRGDWGVTALVPSPDGRFFVVLDHGAPGHAILLLDGVRRTKREIARGQSVLDHLFWLAAAP